MLRGSDRKSLDRTIERGVEQTLGYMKKCHASEGHLVVFDLRDEGQAPSTGAREALAPNETQAPGESGAQDSGRITVWTL